MIYPMKSKAHFPEALARVCKEIGAPSSLVCDPSGGQRSNEVKQFCHKVGTTLRFIEESAQWANRAGLYIGISKESVRQDLRRSNAPINLWKYCPGKES